MITKNEEYVLDIVDQGYEGEGIGKINGTFPVFVEGALKGEKVRVLIVKTKKNFAYGKLLDIIVRSPERTRPACRISKKCGGCTLQHSSYKGQLDFKWDRVKDCIKKIGKLDPELVKYPIGMDEPWRYRNKVQLPVGMIKGKLHIGFFEPRSHNIVDMDPELVKYPIGMDEPWRYRNKVQLPVGMIKGKLHIGFFEPRSHNIVDMDSCLIQDEVADQVVKLVRDWMFDYKIKPYIRDGKYDEDGIVRHIMIRRGFKTNEIMVVIVTNGEKLPYAEKLVDVLLDNVRGLASVIQNVNSEKTNVILGRKNINLWGDDTISDYIGDFKFNISPQSFFQVNPVQTEVLYGKALEFAELTGNETVFDAYCGTGTITLFLSEKAKKVYGVEIVPGAIKNAKINAEENNVKNAEFILGCGTGTITLFLSEKAKKVYGVEIVPGAIKNAKINAEENNVKNAEFILGESEVEIPKLINKGVKADVVVVDPPRKGCEKALLDAITKIDAKRIVYVSCDPSTLARDLQILEEQGYKTVEIQPVDMFPQTSHIECCSLLIKK